MNKRRGMDSVVSGIMLNVGLKKRTVSFFTRKPLTVIIRIDAENQDVSSFMRKVRAQEALALF